MVRFDNVREMLRGGAVGTRRKIILNVDGGWHDVGIYVSCRDTAATPPALVAAACTDGSAATHLLAVTRVGDSLVVTDVVTDARGPRAPREVVRAPARAGVLAPAPMHTD